MKTIKTKAATPRALRKAISNAIQNIGDKAQFDTFSSQSVNLEAKNTKNLASKDLAMLQLCDLAKKFGILVDRS